MDTVKLIAVFSENKQGQMARITKVVADAGANICWATIATSDKFGVFKFLVNHLDAAYQQLKTKGFTVTQLDALAVEVENKPGALHAVAEHLAASGVNIENASGFVANQRAVLLIETTQLARAREVLAERGLRLLTQHEMLNF